MNWKAFVFFLIGLFSFGVSAVHPGGQLQAPVLVDGEEAGMIWLSPSSSEQSFTLEKKGLLPILSRHLARENFQKTLKHFHSESLITIKELKELGFKVRFDQALLNLIIDIPFSQRQKQSIDLMGEVDRSEKFVFTPSSYSGYLNTSLTQDYSDRQKAQRDPFVANFNLINNIGGLVLEGNTVYSTEWTLGDLRAMKDDRRHMIRYTLGDLNYASRGFQTNIPGGGLSVAREFSISPKTITRSTDKTTIVLKRPSVVEIYLNGAMIEKVNLPPGPVDFTKYPFASGNNEVIIRVIDDQGQIENINFHSLYHSEILDPQISEFSYNIDAPKVTVGMKRDYLYQDPRITFWHRLGITPTYTAGLNLQGSEQTKVAGFENLFLTRVGLWGNHLAYSHSRGNHQGYAARLDYESLERWGSGNAPVLFRGQLEYRGPSFKQMDGFFPDLALAGDAYLSTRLQWNASTGLGFNYKDFRQIPDQERLRLDYLQRWGMNWQTAVNYEQSFYGEREKRVFITLTWIQSEGKIYAFNSYDSLQNNYATQLQWHPIEGPHSLQTLAQASQSQVNRRGSLQAEYAGPMMEARITHQANEDRLLKRKESSGQVGIRSALAWTTHHMGISRPIANSFAMVDANPRPANYRIPVGHRGSYSSGTVGGFGPAILTAMTPYRDENYALDLSEVPIGQIPELEAFTVTSPFKGGVDVDINIKSTSSFVAEVLDQKGRPYALKSGRLFGQKGQETAILFSNRRGRIFVEDISPGKYTLIFDEEKKTPLIIEVPNHLGIINDLGQLRVKNKE